MQHRALISAKRYALCLLLVLYAATWIWGIPAVHTAIAGRTISGYKQAIRRLPETVGEHHPRLRFGASYAILPLVTVDHYEYQVAGRWGWGGFTVDAWHFVGTVRIFRSTKWIS